MRRYESGRDVLGHAPEVLPPWDKTAAEFFDAAKLRAAGVVDRTAFGTWWRPAQGWAWDGDTLVVALPSPQFVAWFRACYMPRLADCARELGRDGLRYRFVVIDPEPAETHDGSIR